MIPPENHPRNPAIRSLWLFGLTILPYGVGANFIQTTAPFLLSKAGIPVHTIATISAIAPLATSYARYFPSREKDSAVMQSGLSLNSCSSGPLPSASLQYSPHFPLRMEVYATRLPSALQ
jgi:hypothetical protein